MERKTHIAVVASPGFSHLVPILEFSKRLLHLHPHFHITCFIPSLGSPPPSSKSYLQSLPSNIHSIFLPPIPKQAIPHDALPAIQIQQTVTHSLPYIHQELNSLSSRSDLVALLVDIFALEALDFAAQLSIFSYIYLPQAAMMFSLYYYALILDQMLSSVTDPLQLIEIPGCLPVPLKDLPDIFQNRTNSAYTVYLDRSRRFLLADGVLVNSFLELETDTIRALQEETKGEKKKKKPQIYPVGPIIQSGSSSSDTNVSESECLRWLNNQSPKSVAYVSFGSGGTLSHEQMDELAFGLEQSGQKFLWVVRSPSRVSSAAYLDSTNEKNPLDFLPQGFLERTKDQGLIVPSWAPQIEILSHSSIGAFLSHCGWNSTLESIVHGVPLIAWPLFAEQKMNAFLITKGLKVGVRPKQNEKGIVEREEIEKVIKSLMMEEGEEAKGIYQRIKSLKDAAANAMKDDGCSTKTLAQFAENLRAD